MSVAVVIPCRNEAARVATLLDALATQSVPPDEVIVVDDASTDGTAARVHAWETARQAVGAAPFRLSVVAGPGRGPGPAMNAGIAAATAEVIIRVDGHSRPWPDYVRWSVASLQSSDVGVAGGVWHIEPGADTRVAAAIAAVVSHPLGSGGARYRHPHASGPRPSSVETVPFGAFRKSHWAQLGGFDDALAVNEDFDFNYRTRAAGRQVVLDRRIESSYFARPTLGALARQYFRYGFWKQRMLRKDPRALRARQLPPVLVLPWLLLTLGSALAWPSPITLAAALVYPVALAGGAIAIARARRGAGVIEIIAALAVVHLAWSAGFWSSVVARR